jgi:hypothetical protein
MNPRVKIDRTRSPVILIILTLVLYACGPAPSTFRPLDQREQDVTFLNQLSFKDSTLLLYEKDSSFGYYTLSVRKPEGEKEDLERDREPK